MDPHFRYEKLPLYEADMALPASGIDLPVRNVEPPQRETPADRNQSKPFQKWLVIVPMAINFACFIVLSVIANLDYTPSTDWQKRLVQDAGITAFNLVITAASQAVLLMVGSFNGPEGTPLRVQVAVHLLAILAILQTLGQYIGYGVAGNRRLF